MTTHKPDVKTSEQRIIKSSKKHLVYCVVLSPDEEDLQGDVVSAEDIEKACHEFMLDYGYVMDSHTKSANARIVESFIAPTDYQVGAESIKAGSWVATIKVFDVDLWESIEAGEYTGFSIGGVGRREDVL
jgi:hypothetical protein